MHIALSTNHHLMRCIMKPSKFEASLDPKKAVEVSTIADGTTPWKERIITYMISTENAAHSPVEILENTDPKYNKENYDARKHCLDSQLTYIRQDFNIRTKTLDDSRVILLGVVRDDKLVPFKNAVDHL